jgi:hypothetical protein
MVKIVIEESGSDLFFDHDEQRVYFIAIEEVLRDIPASIFAAFGKQDFDSICGLFSGLKITLQFSPNRIFTCKHPANSLFGKPENGHKKPFTSRSD